MTTTDGTKKHLLLHLGQYMMYIFIVLGKKNSALKGGYRKNFLFFHKSRWA